MAQRLAIAAGIGLGLSSLPSLVLFPPAVAPAVRQQSVEPARHHATTRGGGGGLPTVCEPGDTHPLLGGPPLFQTLPCLYRYPGATCHRRNDRIRQHPHQPLGQLGLQRL